MTRRSAAHSKHANGTSLTAVNAIRQTPKLSTLKQSSRANNKDLSSAVLLPIPAFFRLTMSLDAQASRRFPCLPDCKSMSRL